MENVTQVNTFNSIFKSLEKVNCDQVLVYFLTE